MNKNKVKYSNQKMGRVRVVDDFLPRPEQLALRDESVKVTLNLSRNSVEFFKKLAEEHHTGYQILIRNLVNIYANEFKPCK